MSEFEQEPRNDRIYNDSDGGLGAVFRPDNHEKALNEMIQGEQRTQEQAEDENRLMDWTGIKPGEPITDEQRRALEDLKDTMQQQEDSKKEREAVGGDYIEKESSFFLAQEKRAYKEAEEQLELDLKSAGSGPDGIQKIKDLISDFDKPIDGSKADTDYALTCYLIDRVAGGTYTIDYVPEKYGIRAAVADALGIQLNQPQLSESEPTPINDSSADPDSDIPMPHMTELPKAPVPVEGGTILSSESEVVADGAELKDPFAPLEPPKGYEDEKSESEELKIYNQEEDNQGSFVETALETPAEEPASADESEVVSAEPAEVVAPNNTSSTEPEPFSWGGAYVPPDVAEPNQDDQSTVEMSTAKDVVAEPTDDDNDNAEIGASISFDGIEGSDSDDSKHEVESTGEAIDFKEIEKLESETDSDEESEKKSIWQRAKNISFALQSKIDEFFNDGTEEQNSTKKVLAAVMGATAAAFAVKYGVSHLINEGASAVNSGPGGGITPDTLSSPMASGSSGGGTGSSEVVGHATETVEKIRHGETIWGHVKEALIKHDGKEPSNWKIFKETARTLHENGLNWAKARLLADNTEIRLIMK